MCCVFCFRFYEVDLGLILFRWVSFFFGCRLFEVVGVVIFLVGRFSEMKRKVRREVFGFYFFV